MFAWLLEGTPPLGAGISRLTARRLVSSGGSPQGMVLCREAIIQQIGLDTEALAQRVIGALLY